MKLDSNEVVHRNPHASADLLLPVKTAGVYTREQQLANVKVNARLDIPWVNEVPEHDGVALICGAGPSLADTVDEALLDHKNGAVVFTCIAAQYLIERGAFIDYQVCLDPLPANLEYMRPATVHLLASICDPALFAAVKNPVLWHPLIEGIEAHLPPGKPFTGIGGGVTVTNSTLCLAHTLGFRDIRVHGVDSSYRGEQQYACHKNEDFLLVTVDHGGKSYPTSWYLKQQVQVFMALAALLKKAGSSVCVRGSGLLPDIFNAAA